MDREVWWATTDCKESDMTEVAEQDHKFNLVSYQIRN